MKSEKDLNGSGKPSADASPPKREIEVRGELCVVAEYNGKFWGVQYEDGHSTECGFGPIEKARASDPRYCAKPTDMTWTPTDGRWNHEFDQLKKARLVYMNFRTVYTLSEDAEGIGEAQPNRPAPSPSPSTPKPQERL